MRERENGVWLVEMLTTIVALLTVATGQAGRPHLAGRRPGGGWARI